MTTHCLKAENLIHRGETFEVFVDKTHGQKHFDIHVYYMIMADNILHVFTVDRVMFVDLMLLIN